MTRRRRLADIDPGLALAALADADRAAVERWTFALGAPAGSWHAIPPLRAVVTMLALARVVGNLTGLSVTDASRAAWERLGGEDDGAAAQHPGDAPARTLRRWLEAARAVVSTDRA